MGGCGSVWCRAHTAGLHTTHRGTLPPPSRLHCRLCILPSRTLKAWRAGPTLFFVSPLPPTAGSQQAPAATASPSHDGTLPLSPASTSTSSSSSCCYAVRCPSSHAADQLQAALDSALQLQLRPGGGAAAQHRAVGSGGDLAAAGSGFGGPDAQAGSTGDSTVAVRLPSGLLDGSLPCAVRSAHAGGRKP